MEEEEQDDRGRQLGDAEMATPVYRREYDRMGEEEDERERRS